MKISKVQIPNLIKNLALTAPLLYATNTVVANNNLSQDVFEKSPKVENVERNALSPKVRIAGKVVYPALVVDISDSKLYQYDLDGVLINEYPVRLIENKIQSGINLITKDKHDYGYGIIAEKVYLTKVDRLTGRPDKKATQVIVGAKNENFNDNCLFTNVILIDNNSAKNITKDLTEEQFILIRK